MSTGGKHTLQRPKTGGKARPPKTKDQSGPACVGDRIVRLAARQLLSCQARAMVQGPSGGPRRLLPRSRPPPLPRVPARAASRREYVGKCPRTAQRQEAEREGHGAEGAGREGFQRGRYSRGNTMASFGRHHGFDTARSRRRESLRQRRGAAVCPAPPAGDALWWRLVACVSAAASRSEERVSGEDAKQRGRRDGRWSRRKGVCRSRRTARVGTCS